MATQSGRQNRGSDIEIAYASPTITALAKAPVVANPSPHDGRSRRTRGSSGDQDPVMTDSFVNEDMRVGGPYLCIIPVESGPFPSNHPVYGVLADDRFGREIEDIFAQFEVAWHDWELLLRESKREPEEQPIPTLVVLAQRRPGESKWLDASRRIRAYLANRNLSHFSVEIADRQVRTPSTFYPVRENETIFHIWNAVYRKILDQVDIADWLALECFRIGHDTEPQDNTPTVLITVETRSKSDFKEPREHIVRILQASKLDHVAVCFEKGELKRHGDPTLPTSAWQQKAQLGLSLGVHGSDHSPSTFSGVLELKEPGTGKWMVFGLTCYHCVLPEFGSLNRTDKNCVLKWHHEGVYPNDADAKRLLKLEQPSQKDQKKELDSLTESISALKPKRFLDTEKAIQRGEFVDPGSKGLYISGEKQIEQLEKIRSHILSFRQKGESYLSHVFAASGYDRITTLKDGARRQLDWALVQIEARRLGNNNIIEAYGSQKLKTFTLAGGELLQWSREPQADELVFKLGRSTELTQGRYSALESAHIITDNSSGRPRKVITTEHAVVGIGGDFTRAGDSGAFVFSVYREVFGMIFAGSEYRPISYMTALPDLFEDIRNGTGATDVRLA